MTNSFKNRLSRFLNCRGELWAFEKTKEFWTKLLCYLLSQCSAIKHLSFVSSYIQSFSEGL